MNVVKILLILGLGYVALNQKNEKTRNMLLVVTGLLAFCMFSVEGFGNITFDSSDSSDDGSGGGTITSSNREYVFPSGFSLTTGTPVPDYACGEGKVKVTAPTGTSGDLTADTVENAYPCNVPPDPQKCKDAGPGFNCASGYSLKDDASCNGSPCLPSDFSSSGACCNDKPDFCDCLTQTGGEHINCNSGWVDLNIGKYIKKNEEGSAWELTTKYWDKNNYQCWPMILEDLWSYLGIFSGKCVVPFGTLPSELAKCDPPKPDDDTADDDTADDDKADDGATDDAANN